MHQIPTIHTNVRKWLNIFNEAKCLKRPTRLKIQMSLWLGQKSLTTKYLKRSNVSKDQKVSRSQMFQRDKCLKRPNISKGQNSVEKKCLIKPNVSNDQMSQTTKCQMSKKSKCLNILFKNSISGHAQRHYGGASIKIYHMTSNCT